METFKPLLLVSYMAPTSVSDGTHKVESSGLAQSQHWGLKLYPQRWLLSKHAVLGNYFRSIKITLDPQLLLNISLDMALPTRETKPSSTHQGAGISPSHQKACSSPLDQPHPPGTEQPVDHKHRKSDKMRQRRTMFQKKEQYTTPQE